MRKSRSFVSSGGNRTSKSFVWRDFYDLFFVRIYEISLARNERMVADAANHWHFDLAPCGSAP